MCGGTGPLRDALSPAAIRIIREFGAQSLSNTVWACAELDVCVHPLLSAISAAALRNIKEFTIQELCNTSCAFSLLEFWI